MTKHTPGPWFSLAIEPRNGLPYTPVVAKTLLAKVYSEAHGDFEQSQANGRLMAAAPNLLEVLLEERRIRILGQSPECGQMHWESIREMRNAAYEKTDAAIARALGESR